MSDYEQWRGKRIAFVGCCGEKLPYAAPAKDIYRSDLFRKARAWAEYHCDGFLILSAAHGVLGPDEVIEPYDATLPDRITDRDTRLNTYYNKVQCGILGRGMIDRHGPIPSLVLLAGEKYAGGRIGRWFVERPLKGLGIGERKRFLMELGPQLRQADMWLAPDGARAT